MNIFKAIFGAPKIVDAVINAGDKLVWTDEERKDWALKYLALTQGSNVARRLIACIVVGLWALLVLMTALAWPVAPEYSQFLLDLMQANVFQAFVVVLGFYFATQTVRAFKNGEK